MSMIQKIIQNFISGIGGGAPPSASVEAICAQGIERRCEDILRHMAQHMINPYDPIFAAAEKEIAATLVHSVQPRVLRNAMRCGTPVLVTDQENVDIFDDVSYYKVNSQGYYIPRTPVTSPYTHDFILGDYILA